jgi:hypothetical protein
MAPGGMRDVKKYRFIVFFVSKEKKVARALSARAAEE